MGAPSERALAPPDPSGEFTRAELERLRRGELDADTVAAIMARTRGLAAPEPGEEGALAPNGIGWRVGEGDLLARLYPRLSSSPMLFGALGALGALWPNVLALPSKGAAAALGAGTALLIVGSIRLAAALTLRRMQDAPAPGRLVDCRPGAAVRVTGLIADGPTVPTLFRGRPAVLFKSSVGVAVQTQGIDFDLDLDGGEQLRVCVRRALLLDRPELTREPPACGPVSPDYWAFQRWRLKSDLFTGPSPWTRLFGPRRRYEASVGPGDRVEVCGVLHHEAAPDVHAPFARQMPTRAMLRAPAKRLLLVRSLPSAAT